MNQGRYRVVINGFRVMSQTWDHALQVDGKDDEVYIGWHVAKFDKDGQQQFMSQPYSEIMGDTNGFPFRVQAGSASLKGGLKTGDMFPYANPWILDPNLISPSRNYPPLRAWEGELTEGEDAVVITPSIWEWDGGEAAWNDWIHWGQQSVAKIGAVATTLIQDPAAGTVVNLVSLGFDLAVSMTEAGLIGNATDRPIGMRKYGGNDYEFRPTALRLTQPAAETVMKNDTGQGPGVLTFNYPDDPKLHGHYQLYVQVQRVGSVTQKTPLEIDEEDEEILLLGIGGR